MNLRRTVRSVNDGPEHPRGFRRRRVAVTNNARRGDPARRSDGPVGASPPPRLQVLVCIELNGLR